MTNERPAAPPSESTADAWEDHGSFLHKPKREIACTDTSDAAGSQYDPIYTVDGLAAIQQWRQRHEPGLVSESKADSQSS